MAECITDDRTLFALSLAADLLPLRESVDMYCESCYSEQGALQLLVVKCSSCGGLLVACDNATCPYTLECSCRVAEAHTHRSAVS